MARSCGIRIGPRRFELVVLDGSARKHRLTAFLTGEFPPGGIAGENRSEAVQVLREAIKTHNVPGDATSIAMDTGGAAFRTLKLPSLEDSKIEDVIKFEVETELPQWNIDDVIVDFITLDRTDSETNLLVTAVPKEDVARAIDLIADAGVEPQEVELEATAMVNAALAADICHVDDAQVLVHVGETSSAVVVMDGGRVRSMRAVHIGALTHEPVPSAPPEEGEEEGAEPQAADPEGEAEEMERRLEQAVSRIRRELGRTLSAARTANPIDAVYICGWELPNLVETTIQDVPVYELDAFEEDSGQPATGTAPLVVAYGVALRQLGGGQLRARLRREDLRFTGAFERIELPLAVACLMLATLLGVFVIFELQQVRLRDRDVNLWLQSAINFMYGVPREGKPGNLESSWDDLDRYTDKVRNTPEKLEHTRLEQLHEIYHMLDLQIGKLDKDLGNTGDISQPQSSLEALTRVVTVLREMGDQAGRTSIRKVQVQTRHGSFGATEETVEVRLEMSFFAAHAAEATGNYEDFKSALRKQPWVVSVEGRGSKEFPDGKGIYEDDLRITCDLSKVVAGAPDATAQAGRESR